MPDAYDQDGGVNQEKRFAAALQRYRCALLIFLAGLRDVTFYSQVSLLYFTYYMMLILCSFIGYVETLMLKIR